MNLTHSTWWFSIVMLVYQRVITIKNGWFTPYKIYPVPSAFSSLRSRCLNSAARALARSWLRIAWSATSIAWAVRAGPLDHGKMGGFLMYMPSFHGYPEPSFAVFFCMFLFFFMFRSWLGFAANLHVFLFSLPIHSGSDTVELSPTTSWGCFLACMILSSATCSQGRWKWCHQTKHKNVQW